MADNRFEVVEFSDGDEIYTRAVDKDPFLFAKIKLSPDGARWVIHLGRKYVGFEKTKDSAISRSWDLLRKKLKITEEKEDTPDAN